MSSPVRPFDEPPAPSRDERSDALTEAAIPLGILGLLGSFLYYLLELRSVFWGSSAESPVLRWVCFFFLVGVIGVTRLRTRHGAQVVATPYVIGLAGAMAAFIYVFTMRAGSVLQAPGLRNLETINLLFTYAIVALVWYGASRLTRECTAEETRREVAEHGMLEDLLSPKSALERREEARRRVRHPGWLVMWFSLAALVVFALGQRAMASRQGEGSAFAFKCMLVFVFFALLLLALTTLSAVRMYVRTRRLTLAGAVSPLWIFLSFALVTVIVALAAAFPRLEDTRPLERIAKVLPARYFDREAKRTMDAPVTGVTPGRDTAAPGEDEGEQEPQPGRLGVEADEEGDTEAAGTGEASSGASGRGDDRQQPTGEGEEGEGAGAAESEQAGAATGEGEGDQGETGRGEGEGGRQDRPSATGESRPQPRFDPTGKSGWLWLLWLLLLLLILALIAYLIYRYRRQIRAWFEGLTGWRLRMPGFITGLWRVVAAFMVRLLSALRLRHLAALFGAHARGVPTEPFADPFADRSLAGKSPAEKVMHVYHALLAYADLIGCPREPDQTPLEYLKGLPRPLAPLAKEANQLTLLYVQARYTPLQVTEQQVGLVRAIWQTLQGHIDSALAESPAPA